MTRRSHGLANRPGEPYPATFHISVDPPRVELGSPPRQGGVFPLDHEPVISVDLMGVEPHIIRFKRPVHCHVCHNPNSVGAVGIEPRAPPGHHAERGPGGRASYKDAALATEPRAGSASRAGGI